MEGINREDSRVDDEYWYTADEEISNEVLTEIKDEEFTNHEPNFGRSSLKQHPPVSKQTQKPVVPIRASSKGAGVGDEEECTAEIVDQQLAQTPEVEAPLTMEQITAKYSNIIKYKIFQLAGDDLNGRPVMAFSMSRLPPRTDINHEELFEFMKNLMSQYVENDYTIVYFHYGLNSGNKPSFKMLIQIYKELDRKYKKNLKALLLVHPTNFIKICMKVLNPLISTKFGKKISYITRLDQLGAIVRLDQLDIPNEVKKHDQEIGTRARLQTTASSIFHKIEDPKTKQFGMPVKALKETSGQPIPIVVQSSIDFITMNALDVEGIFRRSAQANIMEQAVQTFNSGTAVEFSNDHVHLAPALLKKFLRDLPEPLLTFELYDKVMESCALAEEERLAYTYKMLNEDLVEENRAILIFLLQFLQLVIDHSSKNRMNSGSLAIVFGPNLLWAKNEASTLTSMSKINSFTKYLIDNSNLIFDESAA